MHTTRNKEGEGTVEIMLFIIAALTAGYFSFALPPGKPKLAAILIYLSTATILASTIITNTTEHSSFITAAAILMMGFAAGGWFSEMPRKLSQEDNEAQAIVAGITHHVIEGRGLDESVEMSLRELELKKLQRLQRETLSLIDAGTPPHIAMVRIAQQSGNDTWHHVAAAVLEAADEMDLPDE